MRKIFIALIVCLIIGIASAGSFAIGTSISQAQYNAIDFQNENINPTQYKVTLDNGILNFDINYDTYVSQGTGTWTAVKKTQRFSYDIDEYAVCRQSGKDKSVCLTNLLNNVRQQWDYFEKDYRDYMERQKIDDFTGEIDPRDLNIF